MRRTIFHDFAIVAIARFVGLATEKRSVLPPSKDKLLPTDAYQTRFFRSTTIAPVKPLKCAISVKSTASAQPLLNHVSCVHGVHLVRSVTTGGAVKEVFCYCLVLLASTDKGSDCADVLVAFEVDSDKGTILPRSSLSLLFLVGLGIVIFLVLNVADFWMLLLSLDCFHHCMSKFKGILIRGEKMQFLIPVLHASDVVNNCILLS